MKKILLIIVASLFSSTIAFAEISIGASMSQSVFAAEGTEDNYDYLGTSKTTVKEYGAFSHAFPSIFVEVGNGNLGIGLNYVPSTISTPENINHQVQGGQSSADTKVSADFTDLTTAYVIAKLPVWGMFVKAGISSVDIDIKESGDVGTYNNTDTDGIMISIGTELELANGFGLRGEITGYEFDDVDANNGKAAGSADANVVKVQEMIGASATISLVKNF